MIFILLSNHMSMLLLSWGFSFGFLRLCTGLISDIIICSELLVINFGRRSSFFERGTWRPRLGVKNDVFESIAFVV